MICDGLIQSGIAKAEYVDGPTPLKGLKILDVGCGGGILCEVMSYLGIFVETDKWLSWISSRMRFVWESLRKY